MIVIGMTVSEVIAALGQPMVDSRVDRLEDMNDLPEEPADVVLQYYLGNQWCMSKLSVGFRSDRVVAIKRVRPNR